jgi:hypothetical protein
MKGKNHLMLMSPSSKVKKNVLSEKSTRNGQKSEEEFVKLVNCLGSEHDETSRERNVYGGEKIY